MSKQRGGRGAEVTPCAVANLPKKLEFGPRIVAQTGLRPAPDAIPKSDDHLRE